MSIWKNPVTLEKLNTQCNSENMLGALGIRFTAAGEDYLEATMPVNAATKQPFGLLHGGASCVLAESLGSVASNLVVGYGEKVCLGIEINANHVKAVRAGNVKGRVVPVHIGTALHVWDIRISDDQNRLVCVSRLSVMVRERQAVTEAPRA